MNFLPVKTSTVLLSLTLTSAFVTGVSCADPLPKGEGQLDIVAWPGYIERGETDKGYNWVSQFEKETGCKIGRAHV